MGSAATATSVFPPALGAGLIAVLVCRRLPRHHFSGESTDVVKRGRGLLVRALPAAAALYPVPEPDGPFGGNVPGSSAPRREALSNGRK